MALFGRKGLNEDIAPCRCGSNDAESVAKAGNSNDCGTRLKVLGSGCAKCNKLEAAAKAALERLGMDTSVDHVTDFSQIAAYGVMTTPALVLDGKVVSAGKVLKTDDIVKLLQASVN